ncbi:MAG: RsiV family protein, partial [Blastocatellia bacterium]
PYLQTVSRICIAQLNKKLGTDSDADWINKGAAAKASNYKVWNVTSRSLVITFDPYQVASYAAGDQTVRIPYTAIKDILDPNGPIASLVK